MEQLQLKFKNKDDNSDKFKIKDICNSAVYAQESENRRPPELYYLVY